MDKGSKTSPNPELDRQLALAQAIMTKRQNMLRELARLPSGRHPTTS